MSAYETLTAGYIVLPQGEPIYSEMANPRDEPQAKPTMTDTLRGECEAYSTTLPVQREGDYNYQDKITDWLLAFARDHQAKGLHIAADLCELEAIVDDERGYYGKAMGKMIREHIEKLA